MRSRSGVLRLALASIIVLAVPCRASAEGSTLRIGVPGLPAALDPGTALDGVTPLVTRQMYDTLVQYREGSSDVEPALATQWTVSRDGLTWTFRLRDGVRFHDGVALEARHVAASLERLLFPGPRTPSPNAVAPRLLRGMPGVVKAVGTPDERTVQITLVQPYAPLLTVLAHPGFSVVRVVTGADGVTRSLGTGPFSLTEAVPGRVYLDANPHYWGGPPRLARLVFVIVEDEARSLPSAESRGLELVFPSRRPARAPGALSVPGWRIGYIALNAERDPLGQKKGRQAIAAALEPARIAAAVAPGAVPLQSFLPPGIWGRREGSPIMTGSLESARRLLAEAPGGRGGTRMLLIPADPPVAGVPIAPAPVDAVRVGEAVQAALSAAGLAVTLRIEPRDTALRLAQKGEHALVLLEAQVGGGDPHLLLFPLSATETASKGPAAWNLSFYRNARLDDLLLRGSQLSFRPERQRMYLRAQAILADELPWIPLYVVMHWAIARPEVRNLRLHPSGFHRLDRVWLDTPGGPASGAAPPATPPAEQ
ncbi:MAG: ABC transporter substrate-binding protein [Candidatus Rokubacteria bacterium]|nr:ABC transporter substrate-binding protein [Candidatus Rokubacteria bacterium]